MYIAPQHKGHTKESQEINVFLFFFFPLLEKLLQVQTLPLMDNTK